MTTSWKLPRTCLPKNRPFVVYLVFDFHTFSLTKLRTLSMESCPDSISLVTVSDCRLWVISATLGSRFTKVERERLFHRQMEQQSRRQRTSDVQRRSSGFLTRFAMT